MRFYDRIDELKLLAEAKKASSQGAHMTIVMGRRRIGKTSLILKAVEGTEFVYLFVSRKSEVLLCADFKEEVQKALGIPVFGEIKSFHVLFEYLMDLSVTRGFTLVIDEFQEFQHINPSVFSEMQRTWDLRKGKSKMNLVLSGSVYALMKKIFENAKEPLFGRANEKIHLQAFSAQTLQEIVLENAPALKPMDLLCFYTVTGGVAKYVELLVDKQVFTLEGIRDEIFRANSFWLDEGKNLLIEEFGKDYAIYFSILSLIASSKTSRTAIESILGKNIGGYLDKLIHEYQVVAPVRPVFAKPGGKVQKYLISDNFLNFWFRFVFKQRNALEIGNYSYMKEIFERDFQAFSGRFLEKWFIEKMAASQQYNILGNYWDKGDNEIDIVAINQLKQRAVLTEVKLNPAKLNLNALQQKTAKLLPHIKGYTIDYRLLSLEDMFG